MRKHIVDENLISALKIAIQKLNDQEGRLESIFSSGAWRVARGAFVPGNYANKASICLDLSCQESWRNKHLTVDFYLYFLD